MSLLQRYLQGYDQAIGYSDPSNTASAYQAILDQQQANSNDSALGRINEFLGQATRGQIENQFPQIDTGLSPDQQGPIQQPNVSKDKAIELGLVKPDLTPQQRWKQQVDALITSGNPTLQKQGLNMMQGYYDNISRQTSAAPKRSASAQIAMDLGFQPGTPAFNKFVQRHAFKSAKMFDDKLGKKLSPAEEKEYGIPKGTGTWVWTQSGPKPMDTTIRKQVGDTNKAAQIVSEMDDMLFGDSGIMHDFDDSSFIGKLKSMGEAEYQKYMQSDPRYKSYNDYVKGVGTQLVRALGEVGATSDVDVARLEMLIPQIGIGGETPAIAQEKLNKLSRLITAATQRGELTDTMLDLYGVPKSTNLQKGKTSVETFQELKPYIPGGSN